MIGSLQWIVTIGRFDVHTAVMTTMSGFRLSPRIGHLNDYSEYTDTYLRWDSRPFALELKNQTSLTYPILSTTGPTLCFKELLPKDAPEPLGKYHTVSTVLRYLVLPTATGTVQVPDSTVTLPGTTAYYGSHWY
jgi:hypothetical protein